MKLSLLLIFFGLLLSNCSESPFHSISKQIEAEITKNNLEISNNSDATIYYVALEQELAARANWAAISTDENAIASKKTVKIPLSEIADYDPGSTIIVFYWTSEDPEQNEISNILVSK